MDGNSDSTIFESRQSAHASPNNFEELRVPGVIGTALSFDHVDDYVDLPISVHPRTEHNQINISFWSYGGNSLSSDKNTHVLESGSSLGRSLNIHFPINSRLYWQAG